MSRTHKNRNVKPMTMNDIDIVMPTHGEIDFLKESLPALEAAAALLDSVKFYIGDTKTKDAMLRNQVNELVTKFGHTLHNANEGYLGGVNYLARRGTGKYIMITTPDVVLRKNAIAILRQTLEAYPEDAIACPLLLFANNTNHGPAGKVQHAGMESTISGDLIHIFIGWDPENHKVQRERRCLTCTGAAFMIRRTDWEKVKGFDPIYGLGTYEDQDLCMKLNQIGKHIHYQPQAVGTHYVGASALYAENGNYEFPSQRNKAIFAQKWRQAPWTDWNVW